MAGKLSSTLETLERLAPGTALRNGIERILQAGKGALIVLGSGPEVDAISSGGFALQKAAFSSARLAELAKMDGGIVLDAHGSQIFGANIHFVPDSSISTDETGSRHRTAERVAKQTRLPVVAVSEGRRVATLYIDGEKIELPSPVAIAAKVNQELQNLDRLRRQLNEAETLLTNLEVSGMATHRSVMSLIQRTELVRRVGVSIERLAVTLGDEGRLATVQITDLLRGVEHTRDLTLADYTPDRRKLVKAVGALEDLSDPELVDPLKVAKAIGLGDLELPTAPRGFRVMSKAGRIPDQVRETTVRHFQSFDRLIVASVGELEKVEGVGEVRAKQLRYYFDRLLAAAETWSPQGI
ncbi:MAG: DNA integrity scanning diadenylate cyclase DisA [Acidimicrobiia bacterium]